MKTRKLRTGILVIALSVSTLICAVRATLTGAAVAAATGYEVGKAAPPEPRVR